MLFDWCHKLGNYSQFHKEWIEAIVKGVQIENIASVTLEVLQRKINSVLGVYLNEYGELVCRNRIFSTSAGLSTVSDIVKSLEAGKIVIIDTSRLIDQAELLIGSIIAGNLFWRYQNYKSTDGLQGKPVISIVIEEAPRVLGGEALA